MRKLILFIHSSVNGVVTGDPSTDKTNFMVWATEASMETGSAALLQTMANVDTILLGRHTYEDLSRKWPSSNEWPGASDTALRLGEKVNNARKLVVTRRQPLEKLSWGKFTPPEPLTGNNIEAQVKDLKDRSGGDIIIFGSPTLVRSLTEANLIDEYQFQVHPVAVHIGEHLFDSLNARKDFSLVDVRALEDGSILVTYAPGKP